MNRRLVQKIFGLFLLLFSVTLLPPIFISLMYQDGELVHFLQSLSLTLVLGLILWLPLRHVHLNIKTRDGFVIVGLFWVVLSLLSALPFLLGPHMSLTDSFFEAVSAFTTTGATVISNLDSLPPSILFYRQQLQWYGGMGVIVLAVAILPMLGIGGMQLYRAETPGPFKDDKIAPRLSQCARSFWLIYVGITVACAVAYRIAGMNWFDAVAHSLSTISTGGFSTHDASFAYFHSPQIEAVGIVFMILGGTNFSIHFLAIMRFRPAVYFQDLEVRSYLILLASVGLIISAELYFTHYHAGFYTALRHGLFQTASIITSTGFISEDFSSWPFFSPTLLFFASFIGGCAGSTAGGMKMIRFIIMIKQTNRDLITLVHPSIDKPLKIANRVLSTRVIEAVWGYFSLYVASFVVIMLLLMATGLDQVTAFTTLASSINNVGPALGDAAVNFQGINTPSKWLLAFAMLLGRLEIFTLLVLLTPAFWRQ